MLLAVKFFIVTVLLFLVGSASARDIYILVIQEGAPENCKVELFGAIKGVYQIDLNGREISAQSPFLWADCMEGNILLPLGQEMIKLRMADRVIFMPIGTAGTNVRDWLVGGRVHQKLKLALDTANLKNIKFDYALWQGRFIGEKFPQSNYISDVRAVIRSISLNAKIEKWIIGLSVSCEGATGEQEVSFPLWAPLINRFPGPEIRALDSVYRSDQCSFNELGQKALAQLWFRAMTDADSASKKYQKESLLYYFKQ